jgi:Protein of unknown function (DUF3187)
MVRFIMQKVIKPFFLLIFFLLLLFMPAAASAFEGPLQVRNEFPLFLHLDSPYIEPAFLESSLSASLSHSSVFMIKQSGDWTVNLDMEITDLDFRLKKVFADRFEVGLDVPVLVFSSGFLDNFLDSYHKTFGFADYGRSTRPANAFLYEVKRNGVLVVKGKDGRIGLGDIRITTKTQLFHDDPRVSILADVELPTGEASGGFGNGSFDGGLALLVDKRLGEKFMSYWNIGVVFPGDLKAMDTVHLKTYPYAGAAIEAALWKHFSLNGQVLFQNSPFPKTGIAAVDRIAALLSLGGKYSSGKNSFEFSITEDPNTAGAPDVIFNLSCKRTF